MIGAQHHPTPTEHLAHTRHRDFHRKIAERAASLTVPVEPMMCVKTAPARPSEFPVPFLYKKPFWFHIVEDAGLKRIPMMQIKHSVCAKFGISYEDIISGRRQQNVVAPRQVAMYLCKLLTPSTLPAIGRAFGGRDHTTALYAIRKIAHLILTDEALAAVVASIRSDLEASIA